MKKTLCLLVSIIACSAQAQFLPPAGAGSGGSPGGSTGDIQTKSGASTFGGTTPGTGIMAALAVNTGSAGAPVLFNGAGGAPTSLTIPSNATQTVDITAVPSTYGGWKEYFVTSSNFTTTSLTGVDITGLVTGTLSASARYEFECNLILLNAADSAGMKIMFHGGGSGTAATVNAVLNGNTTAAAAAGAAALNTIDSLSVPWVSYSAGQGVVYARGTFTSNSTSTLTFSVQLAKVTGNTATCLVGSVLRIRKMNP